jgi:hypothetical protein
MGTIKEIELALAKLSSCIFVLLPSSANEASEITHSFLAMVAADTDALKRALVSNAPSAVDYSPISKPEEVLKEDKEIECYPLKIKAESVTVIPAEEVFQGR